MERLERIEYVIRWSLFPVAIVVILFRPVLLDRPLGVEQFLFVVYLFIGWGLLFSILQLLGPRYSKPGSYVRPTHCPECGYSLAGLRERDDTCPECGSRFS